MMLDTKAAVLDAAERPEILGARTGRCLDASRVPAG
jgi:hypothetical protein